MNDDNFQGFHRAGKAAQHGREKVNAPEVSPLLTTLFRRLQHAGSLTLTPQEKAALTEMYRKAYPAFYAREMADAQAKRAGWRHVLRVIAYVLTGILLTFILAFFFQVL